MSHHSSQMNIKKHDVAYVRQHVVGLPRLMCDRRYPVYRKETSKDLKHLL